MKKIPQRQCTGCREMKNKTDMIRVIRTPDGEIRIDETGKMNGRGAYICRSLSLPESITRKSRTGAFASYPDPRRDQSAA